MFDSIRAANKEKGKIARAAKAAGNKQAALQTGQPEESDPGTSSESSRTSVGEREGPHADTSSGIKLHINLR